MLRDLNTPSRCQADKAKFECPKAGDGQTRWLPCLRVSAGLSAKGIPIFIYSAPAYRAA